MKTKYFICLSVVVLLLSGLFQFTQAALVKLDLLSLGCPTTLNRDQSGWTYEFDLGVQFTEIQNVYMDWSGEITAGLVKRNDLLDPYPEDVGLGAQIEKPFDWRYTSIWAGETLYPNPEPFNKISEFIYGSMPWSELYDGQGLIGIAYKEYIILDGYYIEGGTIELSELKLVVDGTIVPEPGMFVLLCIGTSIIKTRKRVRVFKSY